MTLQDKIHHTNEIANAIQRRQEYYTLYTFDIGFKPDRWKKRHVELPTPQVAGTMTQQRSYAVGKAMDIIESIAL